MSNELITLQQGKNRLARLEAVAAGRFKRSSDAFDRGMRILQRIRDSAVWHYAVDDDGAMLGDHRKPRWEDYIRQFCDMYGVGRSTTFAALNVMDTWKALGLPAKILDEIGLDKAKEVRRIVSFDGRRGQLRLPPPDVIEKLPPAETPIERVKKKIEEVLIAPAIPLTHDDVRDALTIDTGIGVDVHIWETESGRVRFTYDSDDYRTDGILWEKEVWEKLDSVFKQFLVQKLKITER